MTTRRKKHAKPKAIVSVPRGTKVVIKKKRGNPYVLQVGGQKRKIRIAAGRIANWEDV